MTEQPRRLGDRYEVGETLGKGGMAEVHEGRDLRLGRRVAIKILKPELAADPTFLQRFRREAQSAASLNHPNIVAVYDTGEDLLGSGPTSVRVPYIVMEVVDGMTLRQLLQSGRRILPERAMEITAGILAALDYSHRHGIIHRDIKPGNVMINNSGDVKVMDFGIARAAADAGQTMTGTSTVLGTAQYLSPEQARGEVVDSRSDLYSTGVVLYELLAGRPPFQGESPVAVAYQHVSEEASPPSRWDPGVPAEADSIVMKSMQKDVSARYQSALEFKSDIERAIVGAPVTAVIPRDATGPTERVENLATAALPTVAAPAAAAVAANRPAASITPEEPKKANPWLWVGILAALAAVGAGIYFLVGGNSSSANAVRVPDLTGLTIQQAQTTLKNAGLNLGTQTPEVSDKPKDTIISQEPASGDSLEKGQSVDVKISAGKEQVSIPNLVGLTSENDARTALEDVGLQLGTVTEKDSDRPEGHVIAQDPDRNTPADKGSRVNITVSTAKVEVPNVVGKSEAQARSDLSNAGFDINVVTQETSQSPEGTVIAQTPSSGNKVKKGTLVTVTVAKAPPQPTPQPTSEQPTPTPTPSPTGAADAASSSGNSTAEAPTSSPTASAGSGSPSAAASA